MIKKSVLAFVILSVIASAMNYIIYPLFSRILGPDEYVNITVSLSLFTQVSAFLSSILAITIGLSKSEDSRRTNEKIELLQSFLFKLFFTLAVLFLIFSPVIMSKMHAPILFALPISLMMLLSIPVMVISGYLNGKNQMIKLGFVTVISAGSQFLIGLSAALISHDGLMTMLSMTAAQIITLVIVYAVFSQDHLPGVSKPLRAPLRASLDEKMRKLVNYTVFSSVAIMAISLVQIADLFILQNLTHVDVKFYTDIYVVSRVVFFAGMIFIWPFLGEVSLDHHHFNRKPFIKVVGYFTAITLIAILALYFFGDKLAYGLFGAPYDLHVIREVGILSVLYKFLLLIITAVILYFVVLRDYMAVWLSFTVSVIVFIFTELTSKDSGITSVLVGLNSIAIVVAIIGILLLLRIPIQTKNHS